MSTLQTETLDRSATAFEFVAALLPKTEASSASSDGPRSVPRATTLAECVPLLEMALDVVDRGPDDMTIDAIETYRSHVIEILEHIRPILECEANSKMADWAPGLFVRETLNRIAA
jgi:hypothetical protein